MGHECKRNKNNLKSNFLLQMKMSNNVTEKQTIQKITLLESKSEIIKNA